VEAGLPVKSFWGIRDYRTILWGASISDDEGGSHFGSDYHDDDYNDDIVKDEPYRDCDLHDDDYNDDIVKDEPYRDCDLHDGHSWRPISSISE
jgi:hypothetical protein